MDRVLILMPDEAVRLDRERLGGLLRQMGKAGAGDVLRRATGELAGRLERCERLWHRRDGKGLRKCAHSLIAISGQIGMTGLARVARDVTRAIDAGDEVAAGATLFRLLRVGERSLAALRDLRDISG